MRTNAYIDGFNLYHSILSFNDQRLKWLNLRSLCEIKKTDLLNSLLPDTIYLKDEAIKIPDEYL